MTDKTILPRVTHYGTVHFGDVPVDAAVLEDGQRGFVTTQLIQAIGLNKHFPVPHFSGKLAKFAPNALKVLEKSGSPVSMPHGGRAHWVSAEIIPEIVDAVIEKALNGTLHEKQRGMLDACLKINRALSRVGMIALIDEATGYQYHREPDALQDLFTRLIRQSAADWERRFHPDFYDAIYRLFHWQYDPAKPKPHIIGKITLEWVYEPVFPTEILIEIKNRQRSEKMHQWLTQEGGLRLLEKQRDAVELIARSSADYADFQSRCSVAFFRKGQMSFVYPQ